MPRYATHRSVRSLLGPRAGAPAPVLRANPVRPSTPRSLAQYRRDQRRLREERLKRRDYALAKKLGLLPPKPPARPRLPTPPPIAVTREQRAREAHRAALHAMWADMEASGSDRIDLSPRTSPPTWDATPSSTSPLPPPGRPSQRLKRSPATTAAETRSPHPAPLRAPRSDAEREQFDAVIAAAQARADDLRRIADAVAAFKARLTPGQIGAQVDQDFDRFCVSEHFRLYGNRGDRRFWR